MKTERKPNPRLDSGYRLAWRQNYENRCTLYHRHSYTVFPADQLPELEALCETTNAKYEKATLEHGNPAIIQWVEPYLKGDKPCDGEYFAL